MIYSECWQSLRLEAGWKEKAAGTERIIPGIRPEDISISNSGGHTGEIVLLENLGR
jgi:hypothetical protein